MIKDAQGLYMIVKSYVLSLAGAQTWIFVEDAYWVACTGGCLSFPFAPLAIRGHGHIIASLALQHLTEPHSWVRSEAPDRFVVSRILFRDAFTEISKHSKFQEWTLQGHRLEYDLRLHLGSPGSSAGSKVRGVEICSHRPKPKLFAKLGQSIHYKPMFPDVSSMSPIQPGGCWSTENLLAPVRGSQGTALFVGIEGWESHSLWCRMLKLWGWNTTRHLHIELSDEWTNSANGVTMDLLSSLSSYCSWNLHVATWDEMGTINNWQMAKSYNMYCTSILCDAVACHCCKIPSKGFQEYVLVASRR